MTEKYTTSILKLANSMVIKSPGFSLDIGCSAAKLVFRSKEDYENGEPKREELKGEMGQIHVLVAISREKLDDVIQVIKERVDLLRVEGEKTTVHVTGAGCSLFREKLEKELDLTLSIELEFDCFIRSFVHLAKTLSKEDFSMEEAPKARDMARIEVETFKKFAEAEDGPSFTIHDIEENWEPSDDSVFPCVIGMCGSGCGYMNVNEDASFKFVDGTIFGGRTFLGVCSMLTDIRDFDTLYEMVEKGDGRSCDQYVDDLIQPPPAGQETDAYSKFADDGAKLDLPFMVMGKAAEQPRDKVKDEDIVQSLYRCFCLHYAQLGFMSAEKVKVNNLFFVGNLINNAKARYFILREVLKRNALVPAEERVLVRFVRHGGHLGSIGAFMGKQEFEKEKKQKEEKEEKEEKKAAEN